MKSNPDCFISALWCIYVRVLHRMDKLWHICCIWETEGIVSNNGVPTWDDRIPEIHTCCDHSLWSHSLHQWQGRASVSPHSIIHSVSGDIGYMLWTGSIFSTQGKYIKYAKIDYSTQVPVCGWLMAIPRYVTLSGCRGWLLRCSNYFLYGDIGLFRRKEIYWLIAIES